MNRILIEYQGWVHSVDPETRCAVLSLGRAEAERVWGTDLNPALERDKSKFTGELHCMPFGTIRIP